MITRMLSAVGMGVLVAVAVPNMALAWEPKGAIEKKVQNITAQGEAKDADTDAAAVVVKQGDILKYIIEVRNDGQPASNGHNDMHFVELKDTLPAGIELLGNPAQRDIKETLGTIKPGQKVVKEYQVKVTSQTHGQVITNKACFTGDSEIKDAPQKDCDNAVVKVHQPQILPAETPKQVVIPATGPEAILGSAASLSALGYGVITYARAKRSIARSYRG